MKSIIIVKLIQLLCVLAPMSMWETAIGLGVLSVSPVEL